MADPKDDPELDPELDEHLFGSPDDPPPKPPIRLRVEAHLTEVRCGVDLHRVIDDASDAIAADPRTFVRANELVTVVGAPPDQPRARFASGTPIIRPTSSATLVERLTRYAQFTRFDPRKGEYVKCLPPPAVVAGLLARGDWPGVRPLVGVVEHPLLRPDGSVRTERGYDAPTGYLVLPNADFLPVPDHPTQDQARAALATLEAIFVDFPHVSRPSRMVPIAAILTLLARSAIPGSVPAFIFDASTRGSGKSMQADIVTLVAFGRSAARKNYPLEDDELEKVLSSYAVAGARAILLDNVTRMFGGGPIDLCVTAVDDVELRVLGRTEVRRLPWAAVILASGNNVSFFEDTTRRVLIARLESPLENPEARTDFAIPDLRAHVVAHRAELVQAAMTVLRAYTAKGCPNAGQSRWGSFEPWSDLIPGAILFAGGDDPMATRPSLSAQLSDGAAALAIVLRELPRLSDDGLTVRELVHRLYANRDHDAGPDGWDDLRDALEVWAPTRPGSQPDPTKLGRALRAHSGRVLHGRKLVAAGANRGVSRWRAVTV